MVRLSNDAKKRGPTRVPKREEEHVPSGDYAQKLRKLGPRPGESLLAFRKRMFMIEGTRRLWVEYWHKYGGNKVDVAVALGIPRNNIAHELRLVGLTARLLDEHLLGRAEILL